jgi:hypothetical protein
MKVKELIEILKNYPEDMEVWVSDRGYCEGGERLTKVEKVSSHDAGLDGDEVGDEYIYVEDDINISEYLIKGYILSEDGDVLYKEIIYLNDI